MPQVKCKQCEKKFYAKPFWIRRGYGNYCSPACQHLGRRNGKIVSCFQCGKEVYRAKQKMERAKSGMFFCSKSCQTQWRNTLFVGEKHANWKHGKATYRTVLDRHKVPKFCRLCGSKDGRVLEAHHRDKDRNNNTLSNLVWLCRNCHFLVHHYPDEAKKLMVPIV